MSDYALTNYTPAQIQEIAKQINDWATSPVGHSKLVEMLTLASEGNERFRKASQVRPEHYYLAMITI